MNDSEIKRILEAFLLVSDKPLLIDQVREVLGPESEAAGIRRCFAALAAEYVEQARGLRVVEVAEGFQLVTDPDLASFVTKLTRRVRLVRLTKPSLETLAIIAYRQPITRIEMEQVRGVDCGGVAETLLKLTFIRVVGRKETVGRPILYGTTREFLDHFGLKSLQDLPSLEELKGAAGAAGLTDLATMGSDPAGSDPNKGGAG